MVQEKNNRVQGEDKTGEACLHQFPATEIPSSQAAQKQACYSQPHNSFGLTHDDISQAKFKQKKESSN